MRKHTGLSPSPKVKDPSRNKHCCCIDGIHLRRKWLCWCTFREARGVAHKRWGSVVTTVAVAQVVVLAQVLAADINIGYEEGLVNTQARHSASPVRALAHRTQLYHFLQALVQQAFTVELPACY